MPFVRRQIKRHAALGHLVDVGNFGQIVIVRLVAGLGVRVARLGVVLVRHDVLLRNGRGWPWTRGGLPLGPLAEMVNSILPERGVGATFFPVFPSRTAE